MIYSTVEAYVKDKEIIFGEDFVAPKKTMKVLVTFIETQDKSIDYDLYELDKNEVADDMQIKSNIVLKKDKRLFTNI